MNITVQNRRGSAILATSANGGYTEGLGVIPTGQTNVPQQLCTLANTAGGAATAVPAGPLRFSQLTLWPASAQTGAPGGPLTANANPIYVGLSQANQPIKLVATAAGYAITIPLGQCLDFSKVWIYGAAGDGIFYQYT